MRRSAPLLVLLLLAACGSTPPGGETEDPERMGEPIHAERAARTVEVPGVDLRPGDRSPSRVLAYVNGEVITYRDVLLRVGPQLAVLGEEGQRRELEQSALDDIIRDRVVYRAAERLGVEMTRDTLDAERNLRIRELEKSGGTLAAYLAERGMTRREFDEQIRRDWVSRRFMLSALGLGGGDPRVRPMTDVFVSPGAVRRYWERNPDMFREPEHAKLRILVVRADTTADDREAAVLSARAKAERARQRLLAGEDWVPVYRETMGKVADDDADGYLEIRRGEKSDWIEEFAFAAARGAVSDVKAFGSTFFLMRSEGHHAERVVPYEEVHERVRQELAMTKRAMASYEVELKLLESASVQPPERAERLRDVLRTSRRKLQDRIGL